VNYYNEFDPKAAAWLRELISAGLIPAGHIDTRSITEVQPSDLHEFTQCHFFAGVGGWSLALRLAGVPDDYPCYTGSCPCQPFSSAGKQIAQADERHLWPAFFGLIRERRPVTVFGEQVANAIGKGWLDGISADLESEGYVCGAVVLGAHSVGAPHIRQRLYWVANSQCDRQPNRVHRIESRQKQQNEGGREAERMREPKIIIDRDIGRLADADSLGFFELCERNGDSSQSGVEASCGHDSCGCGEVGRLEYAKSERREQRGAKSSRRSIERGRSVNDQRMGSPIRSRLEGHAGNGDYRNQSGRLDADASGSTPAASCSSHWDAFDLLPCLDGKARRVEPGTFPLAHGVPGRVGLLRGYGNGIVPQVAAEFIGAYLDVLSAKEAT
jgi:DNA (cytosine-5)-methyltransferase 1